MGDVGILEQAPPRPRAFRPLRLRSSLLLKSIAAVALALIASTIVTSVVSASITRRALATQSRQLGRGQLSILQEAFAERERTLNLNLRNLAQILNSRGLFESEHWVELTAELGRASANLELDMLLVLDAQGHELVPAAGVGKVLANPEMVLGGLTEGGRSRLLTASDSSFVQATAIEVTSPGRILVGGYAFADQFAYALRRQIGSLDDVLLVAADQVAGSTLSEPPGTPPSPPGRPLPDSPTRVERPDFRGSVAYVPVGSARDPQRGAIGLVLHSPVAPLQGSLARMRLVTTVVIALVTLGLALLLFRFFIRPLVRLAGTAGRVATGDLAATFDSSAPDEIGMLARSLERMRIELQSKLDLIARQAEDLQRQATDLQQTSQRIVAAEDNERHRLARDLHDGIQQQLVVLRMRVGMASDRAEEAGSGMVDEFEQLGLELDATIERLREVTRNLYPSILLDRGLAVAARSYIRQLPTHVHLECHPESFPRLAPEIESGAYFLLCEALTNAFKHAAASNISITLSVDDDQLTVSVEDDGRGFTVGSTPGQGGLLHMHDRVRSFGGGLDIVSAPALGTKVVAGFPNRPPTDDAPGVQATNAPPEPAAAG